MCEVCTAGLMLDLSDDKSEETTKLVVIKVLIESYNENNCCTSFLNLLISLL